MGTIFKSGIAYLGGGGGNANQEELTWDEYEALTEEEKTNGTVYYITDADEIEPDKFRPVIYSEDEREIGVWTDGKPLYQKTAYVTAGNTISTVGLSLKHAQCYSITTSGAIIPLPYNDGSYICWWMSNDAIRFATGRSDISQYVITYQYTKDSDFAGSGKWTPQGIPAKHYSTDEQVIGTWVNGSTVYERTFIITNVAIGATVLVADASQMKLVSAVGTITDDAQRAFPTQNKNVQVYIYQNALQLENNATVLSEASITVRYIKTTS